MLMKCCCCLSDESIEIAKDALTIIAYFKKGQPSRAKPYIENVDSDSDDNLGDNEV